MLFVPGVLARDRSLGSSDRSAARIAASSAASCDRASAKRLRVWLLDGDTCQSIQKSRLVQGELESRPWPARGHGGDHGARGGCSSSIQALS